MVKSANKFHQLIMHFKPLMIFFRLVSFFYLYCTPIIKQFNITHKTTVLIDAEGIVLKKNLRGKAIKYELEKIYR